MSEPENHDDDDGPVLLAEGGWFDPFAVFDEWHSPADIAAHAVLGEARG